MNTNPTVGELCAGVGGFGKAFEEFGYDVKWAVEMDKNACQTYRANFPYAQVIEKRLAEAGELPYVDVITGGFPCQPFSVAGHGKGFDDRRGNVFYDIMDVVKQVRPKVLILENVKGLLSHAGGKTFGSVVRAIDETGYNADMRVLNSAVHGRVPQDRHRVYMVCHRRDAAPRREVRWPDKILRFPLYMYIDKDVDEKYYYEKYACHSELVKVVTEHGRTYQWRRKYVRKNRPGLVPTLTANMGTGGHNVPLILTEDNRIRKLTPRECFRLQGFSDDFVFPEGLADCHLYKQAGNAVTVGVARSIVRLLELL